MKRVIQTLHLAPDFDLILDVAALTEAEGDFVMHMFVHASASQYGPIYLENGASVTSNNACMTDTPLTPYSRN